MSDITPPTLTRDRREQLGPTLRPGDTGQLIDTGPLLESAAAVFELVDAALAVCRSWLWHPAAADADPRLTGHRKKAKSAAAVRSTKPPAIGYPAIADVIKQLRASGKPTGPGVAEHFEVPLTTAKNWIAKCRTLGLLDASTKAVKPPPIAAAAEPKLPANTAPIDWDGPKAQRPHDPVAPVEKVYHCECGHEGRSENELAKHTHSAHGRPPRATEQTRVAAA